MGSQQTSSTTGTAMIARARVYLNETIAAFWSDPELLQWLNDGMVDIAARTHCLQATEAVTLVADTVEYTLSTQYVDIIAAVYNPASGLSTGLEKGNITSVNSQLGATGDTALPTDYYEFGGKIGIYPALTAVTTETVTAYLATRPTAIVGGSNVTTPAVFDKALVYYITAQALLKDEKPEMHNTYMSLYQQELDRYRADFTLGDEESGETR